MSVYPNELLIPERIALLQAACVVLFLLFALMMGKRAGAARVVHQWGARWVHRATARPWLPPVIVGVVAFAGSMAVSSTVRWPAPSVHDEFGYLLIADTFLHGRLSNPTPEGWEHFEAIHMIVRPTYQSKYPPGSGAMIALGMAISGGVAAVGIWLGIALACAATTWMIQGIVEPRWALLGGLLAAMHLGFFSVWAQTYWGGSVAMLGGALLYGSAVRLARYGPSASSCAVLGVGLFILAFTRPYEGLVASLPIGFWLIGKLWHWMRRDSTRARALQVLAVQIVSAMLILLANGLYNHAVTGSATRMPYMEYQRQYSIVPEFIASVEMQPERTPQRFETIYTMSQEFFDMRQSFAGFARHHLPRVMLSLLWICSVGLLIPFLVGAWQLLGVRRPFGAPGSRLLMMSFFLTLTATAMTFGIWPHYFAPASPIFVLCWAVGLRTLWKMNGTLQFPARGLAIGGVLAIMLTIPAGAIPTMRINEVTFGQVREATIPHIRRVKGYHLVLVEYTPQSNPFCDWVFNAADIDNSRIIWATSLGEEKDAALIAKYPDRNLWIYDADAWEFRVRPGDSMSNAE